MKTLPPPMIKVHIVVPVYNTPERFFRECLRSIDRQEHKNFLCVLVDDGSAPETAAICDETAARDSRFIVVRKQNEGLAYARRDGTLAALANGAEYISFIDSDDTVEPGYISMMLGKLLKTGSDVCYCGVNAISGDTTTVSGISPSESGTSESLHEMLLSVLDHPLKQTRLGMRFIVCAGLYRASLFDGADWAFTHVAVKVGEDTRLLWQLMLNTRKAAFLQDGLYNYVQYPVSMTRSMTALIRTEYLMETRYAMIELAKRRLPEFDFTEHLEYCAFREAWDSHGLLIDLLDSGVNDPSSRDNAAVCVRHILHAAGVPGVFRQLSRRQRMTVWILNIMGLPAYRFLRKTVKAIKRNVVRHPVENEAVK